VDLWDLTRLMVRRWYVALPLLLLSTVGGIVFVRSVPPDYKAVGDLQMIPPRNTANQDPNRRVNNPWLDLGYAALGNASMLKVTGDASGLQQLKDAGLSDSVTITMADRSPLLEVEVVGSSAEQATATVREVIKRLNDDIVAEQAFYHVESQDTITTLILKDGSNPDLVTTKSKRILVVAIGVGLMLTVAGTIAFDAVLRRRSRRQAGPEPVRAGPERGIPAPAAFSDLSPSPAPTSPAVGPVITASTAATADRPGGHGPGTGVVSPREIVVSPAVTPSVSLYPWFAETEGQPAANAPVSPSAGGPDTTIVLPLKGITRDDRNHQR
jgi:hypothetical protein